MSSFLLFADFFKGMHSLDRNDAIIGCSVVRSQFLRQQFICDVSVYSTDRLYSWMRLGLTTEMHFASIDVVFMAKLQWIMHYWYKENECLVLYAYLLYISLMSKWLWEQLLETTFIHIHLLPHLMPFSGTNPHSLHNCPIHHISEVAKTIKEVGALMVYLPP